MTPSYITPFSAIEPELAEMQAYLEQPTASDNPAAMMERLGVLQQHMARSGKLKADAEYHYNQKYYGAVMSALKEMASEKLSASTFNKYLESLCRDEKLMITWADRVNRSATHQIDALRTVISYAKNERTYGN